MFRPARGTDAPQIEGHDKMSALSEPGGEGRVKALRYAQATRDQHRATVLPRWPIQNPLKIRTVSGPQFDRFATRGLSDLTPFLVPGVSS